jgi:integrase
LAEHVASIRKRPDRPSKPWQARYRDPSGYEYARHFARKGDAQRWLDSVRGDLVRGSWIDPRQANRTVRDVAEEWLASNPAKRPTTWAVDESQLRRWVYPALGPRRIGTITRSDIQALVNEWTTHLQPRSVRRCFGVARAVFTFAAESEWIARNPCRGVKLPEITTTRSRLLTPGDVIALDDAMPVEYRPMVWLGAMCGLRWGEVAALRVENIDWAHSTVTVAEALTRDRSGASQLGPPKSRAGNRTLTMPGALIPMLSQHFTRQGLNATNPRSFVFSTEAGTALDYPNWRRRIWLPATKGAGLEGAGFHDLRRANATGLIASGVDIKTAQTRLGHSDPRLTLAIYAQAVPEADRAAAAALNRWFTDRAAHDAPTPNPVRGLDLEF